MASEPRSSIRGLNQLRVTAEFQSFSTELLRRVWRRTQMTAGRRRMTLFCASEASQIRGEVAKDSVECIEGVPSECAGLFERRSGLDETDVSTPRSRALWLVKELAGGRIRTYEGQSPPDLQSGPLDHSGTPAKIVPSCRAPGLY